MQNKKNQLLKITRPGTVGIFHRERLLDRLEEGLQKQLIWISSPGGSGKTSLMADFIEQKKLSCLWYRVDERDNDIASFFLYLGMAIRSVADGSVNLPAFSPHHMPGLSTFAKHYFENLFNCIASPFMLVLDNYQDAGESEKLHKVVSDALLVIPPGIHLTIISRKAPPPSYVRFRANNKMTRLTWEDLRFTMAEAFELMKRRCKSPLPDKVLEYYHAKTDGWAAGLMLAFESADPLWVPEKELTILPAESIFAYFATEVIQTLDPLTKKFLVITSVLPVMTLALALELTGLKKCKQILQTLCNNNFFITETYRNSGYYQYHPVFRDFLLAEAKKELALNELSELKRKAARLLAESGQVEDAIPLLIEEQAWPEVIPLILKSAPAMFNQGRTITIHGWINILPTDILNSNPWLLLWNGASIILTHQDQGKACYEKAITLFMAANDRSGTLITWARLVEFYVLTRANYDELADLIKWLEDFLGEDPVFPSQEIEIVITGSVLSALVLHLQNHSNKDAWIKRGRKLLEHKMNSEPGIRLGICLFFAYRSLSDDRISAGMVYDKISPVVDPLALPPIVRELWHIVEALHAFWIKADGKEGVKAIDRGLASGLEIGMHAFDSLLLIHGIRGAFFYRDFRAMDRYVAKLQPLIGHLENFDVGNYHYMLSLRALSENRLRPALENGLTAQRIFQRLGIPVSLCISNTLLAMIYHHMDRPDKADHHLAKAKDQVADPRVVELNCLLPHAYIVLERGNLAKGLKLLKQALSLARLNEYYIFRCEWPAMLTKLSKTALEHDIEIDFVRELIGKRSLFPPKPPVLLENWPWPIKIYTLGQFKIVVNGNPLNFSGKPPQKPLILLKAILARGGRQVSQTYLADTLWPDTEGDASSNSLKKNLQRLRRLMEVKDAILLADGQLSINDKKCWIDFQPFEKIIDTIESVMKTNREWQESGMNSPDPASLLLLAEKACRLYQGPFLSNFTPEPWTAGMTDRLQQRMLRMVSWIGNLLEDLERLDEAVEWYLKGLEVDPRPEEYYQRLMICYNRLGRRTEALILYDRCKKTLDANFGITPSAATRELYFSIQKDSSV